MAVAWPLILIIIALFAMSGVACLYVLVTYQHPDDKNTAWLPKIVFVVSLAFAMINVFLLPLDVANRNSGNTLDFLMLVYIVYAFVIGLCLVVVPFSVFFYESERAENNHVSSQLYNAMGYTCCTFLVFALIAAITYALMGRAEIPIKLLTAEAQSRVNGFDQPCVGCAKSDFNLKIHVSLLVYLVALLSVVGTLFLVCFGGVGVIALPWDLVDDWRHRPQRIPLDVFSHKKVELGSRAARLVREGETIQRAERERGGKRNRKIRKQFAKWQAECMTLDKEYRRLVEAYRATRHPWWNHFWLGMGILCMVVALLWFLHIVLYMMFQPPKSPFLNDMFIDLDKTGFPLFGAAAYALFAYFLLCAVIKGNIKVGFRVAFFTIHPMIPGETLMNSLLFNVAIILLSSIAVSQFCASAFSSYSRLTAISSVFGVQMGNLVFFSYIFKSAPYVLIIIASLTVCWFCICPYGSARRRKKKRQRQREQSD